MHDTTRLTHPRYRADIDGLRAIAVLAVIGFHAFPDRFPGGFIGVDIFFVISGFLISTIIFESLERGRFSFSEFYGRRIRRIFPALVLVLAATYAFGWFHLLAMEYKQLGRHIAGGAGFLSNFVLWDEAGYFDTAAETKPLLHLWSLGIEEQFYVCWPLLLWLAWKMKWGFLRITLALGVISFALNIDAAYSNVVAAFYAPQTRFWELMAGALLAHRVLHGEHAFFSLSRPLAEWSRASGLTPEAYANIRAAGGLLMVAAGLLFISRDVRFPGWWALLPVTGTVLMISAGPQAWLNRALLANRALVWIGLISYPLYLWHWPLLSYARIVAGDTPPVEVRVGAVLLAVLLAWLTYQLLEKPIRAGNFRVPKTAGLLAAMLAVGYVGYNTEQRDGLGFRFPQIVQDLTEFNYDHKRAYREGSCFLTDSQDYRDFAKCDALPVTPGAKSIFIWGDSHAAHLYPGYQAVYGADHAIIQRTTSACPPILDVDGDVHSHCREINAQVLQLIKSVRPQKIVLAANWTRYDWRKIGATIAQLRGAGFGDIDLVGPGPQWAMSLPVQLYRKFKSDPAVAVPRRMALGLKENFAELDAQLAAYAAGLNVNYLSPARIFCDKDGCLTRLGETGDTITFWDCCHLTDAGSRFLMTSLARADRKP